MDIIVADEVPGFGPALAAVRRAGGVLLTDEAARALTVLAVHALIPWVKAEQLADMADDFEEMAAGMPAGDESGLLLRLSSAFDTASYQIREALHAH